MALGDSTNNWQWPTALTKRRVQKRPHLSINKTAAAYSSSRQRDPPEHAAGKGRVVLAAKRRKKRPRSYRVDAAHLNAGEAPVAVSHAAFWQVTAGCGYFYIANDWIDDGSRARPVRPSGARSYGGRR